MTETINQKLMRIQSEVKAGKILRNNFGNYNYRSAESIIEESKPILLKHNCYIVLSDDIINIGDRYYIKATAKLVCDSESIETTALAREAQTKKGMDDSQITGSASSYARKYALSGLLLLDDGQDADSQNINAEYTQEPEIVKSKPLTISHINTIQSFDNIEDLKSYCADLRDNKGFDKDELAKQVNLRCKILRSK